MADDASRLAKERILNEYRNNVDLREAVRLALDSLTQFYIRKIPTYIPNKGLGRGLQWAFVALKDLSHRVVTGYAAIEHLVNILEGVNEKDALVIERIIAKDLRCGVSTATANKIWPDLVHEFPCMLASQFDQKLANKFQFPGFAQIKLDGMRCSAVIENGAVTLYSRNGKILDVLGSLEPAILSLGFDNAVLDGELLILNKEFKPVDRKTGNGILNKAVKGTINKAEAESIQFVAFDLIPLQDFRKEICIVSYKQRFETLGNAFMGRTLTPKLKLVSSWIVTSHQKIDQAFSWAIEAGEEGIILKDPEGVWENKRTKTQIKYKAELDCDLKCVGVMEGTGKNVGKMGALLLESADSVVKVAVGTGFTDQERAFFWENKPLDKIVAICYNARINDKKTGLESLFLPRYLEVREDKSTADLSKVIK